MSLKKIFLIKKKIFGIQSNRKSAFSLLPDFRTAEYPAIQYRYPLCPY